MHEEPLLFPFHHSPRNKEAYLLRNFKKRKKQKQYKASAFLYLLLHLFHPSLSLSSLLGSLCNSYVILHYLQNTQQTLQEKKETMVFSSVPAYLDPNNWQQQHNHQQGSSSENHQLPPPMPPPGVDVAGAIRPNSMAERARLAKVPPPEPALKCPRCNSINTKFCYFNNYSLTQPRHFCKTCRRYWTRGGALRNVPVGGGCRRNKKSKGSSSKSPASSDQQTSGGSTGAVSSSSFAAEVISRIPPLLPSQLPFMSSLGYGASDMGLNYSGIQMAGGGSEMEFQIGSNQTSFGSMLSSGIEQWRLQQQLQQSPYLSGLEPPSGLYPLEGERVETSFGIGGAGLIRSRLQSSSGPNQQASVKSEGNQGLNSSRQFLGIQGNDQYLDGNTWTDLSNFTSSSNTHLL